MLNSFKGFHLWIKKAIMWYPGNQLRKILTLCMLLAASKQKHFYKNQIRIQHMYYQFKYEQLHISAKTTVKILTINNI